MRINGISILLVTTLFGVLVHRQVCAENTTDVSVLDTNQTESPIVSGNFSTYIGNVSESVHATTTGSTLLETSTSDVNNGAKSVPFIEQATELNNHSDTTVGTISLTTSTADYTGHEEQTTQRLSTSQFSQKETARPTVKFTEFTSDKQETTPLSLTTQDTQKNTTMTANTTTKSEEILFETPEEFFKYLNSIQPETTTSGQSTAMPTDQKTSMRPPDEFFQWLDSIHVQSTETPKPSSEETARSRAEKLTTPNPVATESLEEFFRFLDSISPDNTDQTNSSKVEESKPTHVGSEPMDFNPDSMPPKEFIEWLNSIYPDKNATNGNSETNTNIIDTSIITTQKLIIVISTICGTFVLFVVILIIVSCCRRKHNVRSDSEKSDFSVTSGVSAVSGVSGVSTGSTISTIPENHEVRFSDTGKNGYSRDLFMGIPANNKIWKDLEQLPPTAPSVMPECTRM